jgi:hypothetical protein
MSKGADNLKRLLKEIYGEHANIIEEHYLPGNLRLDYYMPSIGLAFEFHGRQHTEFVAHFHKDASDFRESKARDDQKSLLCHRMNIVLVSFWDGEVLTADSVSQRINQSIVSFVPFSKEVMKTPKQIAKEKARAYQKELYQKKKQGIKDARLRRDEQGIN